MRMTYVVLAVCVLLAGLAIWRMLDHRADRAEMDRLLGLQPAMPKRFQLSMIEDLPEPARRYLAYSIAEGTPLKTVAHLTMTGRFGMGEKAAPKYMEMTAEQVLAVPEGFVWKMAARTDHLGLSGSDSARWTRFWMGGLLPVARAGGDSDHARSAFGRYAAEAVIWTPAAVLPGPNVTWEAMDDDRAAVTIRQGDQVQRVEVTVAEDGRPTQVVFPRWSNANPEKTYQIQPFGGFLSDHREVQGFRVAMHVEAGNFFGTEAYFPFFIVDVDSIAFPGSVEK